MKKKILIEAAKALAPVAVKCVTDLLEDKMQGQGPKDPKGKGPKKKKN